MELNAIADKYADWQKETGVVFMAISIDDEKVCVEWLLL
jgi:alkyl hydroperoxide reductase subunit AhpC